MPGYDAARTRIEPTRSRPIASHCDTAVLIDNADPWGEAGVIREVAYRAGLLWACRCGWDNPGNTVACGHCSRPSPE